MRRRDLILASESCWRSYPLLLDFARLNPNPVVAFGIVSGQRGHFGNFYSGQYFILWVTNIASFCIRLGEQTVQRELFVRRRIRRRSGRGGVVRVGIGGGRGPLDIELLRQVRLPFVAQFF